VRSAKHFVPAKDGSGRGEVADGVEVVIGPLMMEGRVEEVVWQVHVDSA